MFNCGVNASERKAFVQHGSMFRFLQLCGFLPAAGKLSEISLFTLTTKIQTNMLNDSLPCIAVGMECK